MTDFDASPQLRLVKKLFDAYFDSRDIKKVEPLISKNYQYHALPESLGLPKEEREEHIQRIGATFPLFSKIEVTYQEVIETPGKVVVQSARVFSTPSGDTFNFNPVSILTIVEEDGELKVLHAKDFGDPEGRMAARSWLTKAVAEKAA